MLYLIHNSSLTGPSRMVYGLAKYSDKNEFCVDVLCPQEGYLPDMLRKDGIKVINLPVRNLWNLAFLLRLCVILKKGNYQIFHIHSGQLNAFGKIIAGILGVPVLVATEHVGAQGHSWIKNKFRLSCHMILHKLSNALIDRIIAVSDEVKNSCIKRQGISAKKVITIHNGVDTQELTERKSDPGKIRGDFGIPLDALVVGMVARFYPEKGQRVFVFSAYKIAQKDHQARFVLMGNGPQRREITELVQRLGLKEKFVITGFRRDASRIMDMIDIFAQPSLEEAFGLAAVEAMAKKKPVIASSVGALKEIIRDGQDGLLFPAGDTAALAQEMGLMLHDAALREQLGEAGQKRVIGNFDIRNTTGKTAALYKELLLSKGICTQSDYFAGLISDFLDSLRKTGDFSPQKVDSCAFILSRYVSFAEKKNLSYSAVQEYLAQENNFVIEIFLQFLERNKAFMDKRLRRSHLLFKQALRRKCVTDLDYDERISMQSLQHQLDNYYCPKDKAQAARIDFILSFLRPEKQEKVLDIGCGVGTFSFYCAQRQAQSTGLDYSRESVVTARQLVEKFGVARNTEFICCDACAKLPFADAIFDKIIAADFVEHIDDAQKQNLLSEMHRVLKPEGRLIIVTPNGLREMLGSMMAEVRAIFGLYSPETRLHYGLTNRFKFEKLLSRAHFSFKRRFFDISRPLLAKMPLFKEFFSLDILWVIKKHTK